MARHRKTPSDYHNLAKKRGFKWLGAEVENTQKKTGWQCLQGHEWQVTYHGIQRGDGCPFCSSKARKIPIDYHGLAKKRGFKWIGPEVSYTRIKTGWQCSQCHKWEATYNCIQRGYGCPFCSGLVRKTPIDYHDLAKERGFEWLGPEVLNTRNKTGWQCPNGHKWQAVYSNVQQGSGCPFCSGRRKV